ncbi:ABC transporter permease subunit [Paenibacillus rhizoplanae]
MLKYLYSGILEIAQLSWGELIHVVYLGLLTALRVVVSTLLAVIWTLPVGVFIGTNPRLSRIVQPVVQVLSSFPANMAFPIFTILYLKYGISMEIGAIPLMMLGTQWYVLFNVIAGAMAIPSDLKEAAVTLKLTRWQTWKTLILPAVFPLPRHWLHYGKRRRLERQHRLRNRLLEGSRSAGSRVRYIHCASHHERELAGDHLGHYRHVPARCDREPSGVAQAVCLS